VRAFRSTNFPDIGKVVFATNDGNRLRCASLMPDFMLSVLQPLNVMMVLEYKATTKDSRLDEYVVLAFRFQGCGCAFFRVPDLPIFLCVHFVGLCRGIAFFLGMVVAARLWLGMEVRHRAQALKEFLIPVGHIAGKRCFLYFLFFARTWVDARLVALIPTCVVCMAALALGNVALSAEGQRTCAALALASGPGLPSYAHLKSCAHMHVCTRSLLLHPGRVCAARCERVLSCLQTTLIGKVPIGFLTCATAK
jgi:hypothetical protein